MFVNALTNKAYWPLIIASRLSGIGFDRKSAYNKLYVIFGVIGSFLACKRQQFFFISFMKWKIHSFTCLLLGSEALYIPPTLLLPLIMSLQ